MHVPGVPDVAIAVRSPSTWKYDVGVKLRRYERAGVAEVWLVDTESRSVLVFRPSESDKAEFDVQLEIRSGEQLTSPLLPEFALEITQLFDR